MKIGWKRVWESGKVQITGSRSGVEKERHIHLAGVVEAGTLSQGIKYILVHQQTLRRMGGHCRSCVRNRKLRVEDGK